MKPVIEQLRAEHLGMAQLLAILETQVGLIEGAGEPDYPVIEDIVLYFLDFPDTCHHPKEDLIAARLLEMAPERAAPLLGLADAHRDAAVLTAKVAAVLGSVLNEEIVPRARIIGTVQAFIAAQRLHMQMEDEIFLPLAAALLGDAELAGLASAVFEHGDPLGRAEAEERFSRLKETVLNWAQAR